MKTRPIVFCSLYKCISKQYLVSCSVGVYFFVKGTSVLLFGILNVTKTIDRILISWCTLQVKHFVVVEAFVGNECIFIRFKMCISINFVFVNKNNIQEARCLKSIYCHVFKLSAPNFYCSNFNDRAAPWAFPLESVCKSRVGSRAQCVTNGAENSTS